MNQFKITWRCDQEEYYCTDSVIIQSSHSSVVDFVQDKDVMRVDLGPISSHNTIISIERIM